MAKTDKTTATDEEKVTEETTASEQTVSVAELQPEIAPEPWASFDEPPAPGPTDDRIRKVASAVSVARMGVGAVAILAPGLTRRVMGLSAEQDTAGLRMMARLFGVREIVVGAHCLLAVQDAPRQPGVFAMNAAVDGGDAAVLLMTVAAGKGARRAAAGSMLMAVPIVSTWLWLRRAASQ